MFTQNKGFTLIELLAVIVILAIIAVIATPIITGIIEDSKKESFKRSAEGV
ncbi:MAG: prepilin-type N-terminal cleavage/methylation domain-containing protein, partial [Firmicutes bacterium]|nr:prepilin-type N-terminal cleavage/methylation domain-containing protein [Bacillota bacterium]